MILFPLKYMQESVFLFTSVGVKLEEISYKRNPIGKRIY